MVTEPTRTLLEIITTAYAASGHRGPLTRRFIRAWRAAHPDYGHWPLSTQFRSGSALAVRGTTRLDRAGPDWENAPALDKYCDEFYGD